MRGCLLRCSNTELVGAKPLHLLRRPFGRLKFPLGTSLLRKREVCFPPES